MNRHDFIYLIEQLTKRDKELKEMFAKKRLTPVNVFDVIKYEVDQKSTMTTLQKSDLYMAVICRMFVKKSFSPTLVRNTIIDEFRKYHREHSEIINGKRKRFINFPPEEKEEEEEYLENEEDYN